MMEFKAVFFDLDGTLLPMDQEMFVKAYFHGLAEVMAAWDYDPKMLTDAVWMGTRAMVINDGKKTNEDVFWDTFAKVFGENARADQPLFEEFYRRDFQKLQKLCGFCPEASEIVLGLKAQGIRVVLATNPLFPAVATESRIRWAGMDPTDFELITTYENSRHCKPNPDYYRDILGMMQLNPEECLMVGNDAEEDMVAQRLGMQVFLLTDCLINQHGGDITRYPRGGFCELRKWMQLQGL